MRLVSSDDYIPPHGESSASIGKRSLGILELMSRLKSVSVEHRGVGASSAFPTLAGIPPSPCISLSCKFSLILRSIVDADKEAH